ncbi:hypothetical protein M798_16240 [Brucella melitensis ADMAS-G1]|nr:hypothetical protein M798_16240 [Brucella melitensis ADMAS-G1]
MRKGRNLGCLGHLVRHGDDMVDARTMQLFKLVEKLRLFHLLRNEFCKGEGGFHAKCCALRPDGCRGMGGIAEQQYVSG